MHNYYSNRVYMHGYYSTCINILVIFSLSLSLLLSPHSPSRLTLRDQHHTIAARRTRLINITPLSPINIKPHVAWSNCRRSLFPYSPFFSFDQDQTIAADQLADQDQTTATDQYQTIAARSLIKSSSVNSLLSRFGLGGWWFGFRIEWVLA